MIQSIRESLWPACGQLKASADWRRGGTLIWFGGILVISGAVLLPVRPQVWMFAKLLILAAAIHWTVALPIAEWGWL